MVAILITDSATGDTKILDSSTVVDTYNSTSSVLITTQTSSKRKKRSAIGDPIHTYGPALAAGCKYGNPQYNIVCHIDKSKNEVSN